MAPLDITARMRRMSFGSHVAAIIAPLRLRITRAILAHRIRARHPTLHADPTAIWDYGYHDLDAIEIGKNVSVGPFAEIIVYSRSRHSQVPGRLVLEDRAIISMSADIRAAGGTIRIGENSGVGQHNVLVAANHQLRPGELHLASPWDEERTGVDIGRNVWVAAGCILLPGCVIGDNSVIAAGSVVRGTVPSGEVWGGVPARKIKTIGA
jgi:acetyltransferase-like isoleucine patch superfamily enzyme